MTNKISAIAVFILMASLLFSCKKYLDSDQYFKDRLTLDKSFNNVQYIEEWLANSYSYLTGVNADVASKGYEPFNFSDDIYYGDRDVDFDIKEEGQLSYNAFSLGNYHENDKQDSWTQCYQGIRSASIFIYNIDASTVINDEQKADYKAQARFVRAYYYWLLLRKYGPIPIIPDEGADYTKSYDELALPRSSYEACAEYIGHEMVLAAKDLPQSRGQLEIARPTKGAALATRAKVFLYAASPLMNGGKGSMDFKNQLLDDQGNPLLGITYDEEKWARAAAAAKDVMNLGVYALYVAPFTNSGTLTHPATIAPPYNAEFSDKPWPDGWANIDPYQSYRALFDGELSASENPELIFTRGKNQSTEGINVMVVHQLPRIASGWNTHGMTLKQCDAYYMNDGSDVPGMDQEYGRGNGSQRVGGFVTDEDVAEGKYKPLLSGVSLQFANREPRFYASVGFNGSLWDLTNESEERNREQQVFYYRGSGNGYTNTMFWLRTGIGIKKYVNPQDTYENGDLNKVVPKYEPAIRYADILLEYTEALNELTGSYSIPSWDSAQTYTVARTTEEMRKGLRPVRIRAGVPDFSDAVYSSNTALRKAIKRERQVELMGEQERYYDLRRWDDAATELALPIYGYNVLMTSDQRDLFHQPVAAFALQSTFAPKMYFWPISLTELQRDKRLTQNPGWLTYNN
ncbi:Starch-binding associating with outer membrane [Arachidicoccus rhizosphaerae]|uniref:Starch-binding associating with outer membrane n=1 Tax=Arachidicoccus rhizosphaerae TaxID=551991 RepID=A0A1H3WGR8_9BACT|nr:RagB/SusD family nutrient uptake outer membrane protein [Arachidicoccus rhizosphaerae]SDZ86339.1 Starch-binding associating with outer membrane [Arachidicoccus rhizosphaerae]